MRRLPIALLLVLVACTTTSTPGPVTPKPKPGDLYQVTFVVRDEKGVAIPEADVTVPPITIRTNANGFAEFRVAAGAYAVSASSATYRPAEILTLAVERAIHRDLTLVRDVLPASRLSTEGRFFVTAQGTYRPRWASGLSLLARPPPDQAVFLDEVKTLGFDGVRVFAGDLDWAGQTTISALQALPAFLQAADSRGLYTYLVAVTGSGSGFDVETHLRNVAMICVTVPSCVLEAANELGHSSQSSHVNDPRWLEAVAVRSIPTNLLWTLGASLGLDEPDETGKYPPNGDAPFNTAHLDRGRDKWNMIRRVREIAGISENTNKPAMSGEPIGAAEADSPGRRIADPNFFFAYGALCRLFEIGCVFHSEDGLFGRPLGPVQKEAAQAFIAGWRAIATDARLSYQNTGWGGPDAPVAEMSGAVRVYAGIRDGDGYAVVVGDTGVNITWKNGWNPVGDAVRRPGVQVIHIRR